MRTTLDIDDDVLAAAEGLASAQKMTVGKVISDLARKALAHCVDRDGPIYIARIPADAENGRDRDS